MKTTTLNHKKIVYVDMDNVLVDFPHGIECLSDVDRQTYEGRYDECPGIFQLMRPMEEAIESFHFLSRHFDTYVLSTSPWLNASAWGHKLEWVQEHLGDAAYKRLILSHHKNLNRGDYLIDDREKNGAGEFEGELILFGSENFPSWPTVIDYLSQKEQL